MEIVHKNILVCRIKNNANFGAPSYEEKCRYPTKEMITEIPFRDRPM